MNNFKKIVVLGGTGMIGHHLARKLKNEGHWVRVIDIKDYEYGDIDFCNDFVKADLKDIDAFETAISRWGLFPDEVYNCAAWMGGAGVIFTGENDAQILNDNIQIVLNLCKLWKRYNFPKVFHCSSACMYNHLLQLDTDNKGLKESDAFPAFPDSDYGWSKLIEEKILQAYNRNYGMNIRIARFHNIYGIEGAWNNGKEKFPAAICRKVAMAKDGDEIEIWGSGTQTRSFLAVSECLKGIERLMDSDCIFPINIGSDEMISINDLAKIVIQISGKNLTIKNIDSTAIGVNGRNSDNTLISNTLNWKPNYPIRKGIEELYKWVENQVNGK